MVKVSACQSSWQHLIGQRVIEDAGLDGLLNMSSSRVVLILFLCEQYLVISLFLVWSFGPMKVPYCCQHIGPSNPQRFAPVARGLSKISNRKPFSVLLPWIPFSWSCQSSNLGHAACKHCALTTELWPLPSLAPFKLLSQERTDNPGIYHTKLGI